MDGVFTIFQKGDTDNDGQLSLVRDPSSMADPVDGHVHTDVVTITTTTGRVESAGEARRVCPVAGEP